MSQNTLNETAHKKFYQHIIFVLFFLLICRIVAMHYVPLNDSTESRYGEIARIMAQTNNWVTPMHFYDQPFWAKPPLSTWLSAASIKLLGVSEFAVRLPGLLLSIGILGLVWGFAKRHSGTLMAATTVLVLASNLYFLLDAGTVMTDPSLLFCTTLIFISFWNAVVNASKPWGYVFFVGLGLGLLAKGPVALVLMGMPIFVWICMHRKWSAVWKNLPWVKGGLLTLAIALPWYIWAEIRTPGFLHYFIVGEHIQRFLEPGWDGDKYGFAHSAPYGMIWVYALMGMLPWSIAALVWFIREGKKIPAIWKDQDGWINYLVLCAFVPLIFFTFARNIIYPYVFPSLPLLSLLFAELVNRCQMTPGDKRRFIPVAAINGCLFLLATFLFVLKPELVSKSQDRLVALCDQQQPVSERHLIFWDHKTTYSAQFYSRGNASATLDANQLCDLLMEHAVNYVVLNSGEPTPLPTKFLKHLSEIATVPVLQNNYTLYRAESFDCKQS